MVASAIGAAIATGIGVATGAVTVGAAFSYFLATTAMGAALNALAPKPKIPNIQTGSNTANRGYQITTRGARQDHQIIYGETRVGGAIVFDAVSGANNKFLHRVVAFAGHEIEEFKTFYFNDEFLTLEAAINSASGETYYRPTLATDKQGNTHTRYNNRVNIYLRKGGTENNNAIVALTQAGVDWTTDHKLQGVAYAYFRLQFDADTFANGVPDISCVIKGKKVYDPRTEETTWSSNPALCIRDYLTNSTYGLGEDSSSVDDPKVIIAADVCDYKDYDVNNADPDSTKTGGTRFSCNGAFTTAVTPHDHLLDLLTCMGGNIWYGQGKWRMKAAHYVEPTVTFTMDDLRSNIGVSTRHSRRDNFNTVKGTFRGAQTDYQPTDYAEVTNTAFRDADNGQISVYDLDLPFTDNFDIARRIALITLERNRQQLTVQASFGMKAFQVQVGDIVKLTMERFGWTEKEFEVMQWTFGLQDNLDLQVQMTLREISENVYDDISDGQIYERDNTTLLSPFEVPIVSITPANQYGGIFKVVSEKLLRELQIVVSTTDPSRLDHVEVQYRPASTGDYLPIGSGDVGRYSVLDLDEGNYDARARGINTFGVKGDWAYVTNFLLAPIDSPPSAIDPSDISFDISQGTLFLNWEPISDLDLSYYQVKVSSDITTSTVDYANDLWGGNSNIVVKRVARPATSIAIPAKSGTILIKSVDKAGNYSVDTGYVVIDPSDLPVLGNVITQTETNNFNTSGNTNITVDTSTNPDEITINDTSAASPTGTYTFGGDLSGAQTVSNATYIDVGTSRTVTVSSSVTQQRHIDYSPVWDNIPQLWDTWPDTWDEWTNEDAGFGDFSTVIEVRATPDDPSGSPTWGDWRPADGSQYIGRGFQFRARLLANNSGVSPAITSLTGTIGY
jgi:hypothetical protein